LLRPLRSLWAIVRDVYTRFLTHDAWAISSHVAMSVLLALFPFLIVVTALASLLGTPDSAHEVINLAFEGWPSGIADPLAREITRVLTGRRLDLLTIGVALTLWTSSSGVEAMRVAMTRAYGTPDHRSWWWTRIQSIGFVLLGAVGMLMLSFAVVLWDPLWQIVSHLSPHLATLYWVGDFVRYTLTGLFLAAGLLLAHVWLPPGRVSLFTAVPGVILTLILWLVGASAFGYWFSRFSNYASTYAGLGSIMAVIFFLYINSAVFILGGEVNAVLCARREAREARQRHAADEEDAV